VNASLSGLQGRILSGTDLGEAGNGQVDRDQESFGHGTAMASIMVSRPSSFDVTGLAPGARVLPIAVPLIGTTDAQGDDHLDEAIRYAADHGAKIISMSLGGTRTAASGEQPCYTDEQEAIFYAMKKGALLFAASGNAGKSGSPVEEPGVCLGVVSVGATTQSGQVADFSSRHPYLTLTAPGVNVASLGRIAGQAYSGDGTSQATALASAAAALVWSKSPKLTAKQVLARLIATTDHHSTTASTSYGYGIVNPYRAITQAVPASAPDPVYTNAAPFMARTALSDVVPIGKPPAPATHTAPEGTVTIASAPSQYGPQVLHGLLIAGLGLLLFVVLVLGGVRNSRRRRAAAAEAQAALYTPPPPPPPTVDSDGVEWHQL
jgi:subtilisin family serine protease